MKALFGFTIAVVLLGIYVFLVFRGIAVGQCLEETSCTTYAAGDFTDRMASSLALIAGLVSALVISELAVTPTGEMPGVRMMAAGAGTRSKSLLKIATAVYLVAWLVAGLAAYVFGYLQMNPETLPALSDLGQSWLGIAVGAAYAYFGIQKPGS